MSINETLESPLQGIVNSLRDTLLEQGFTDCESRSAATMLCRFKNFYLSCEVAWVDLPEVPEDITACLRDIWKAVVKDSELTPIVDAPGLQLILCTRGLASAAFNPRELVNTTNFESVFLVDPETYSFRRGRSAALVFTAKIQDLIDDRLFAGLEQCRQDPIEKQLCLRCGDRFQSPRWLCSPCHEIEREQEKPLHLLGNRAMAVLFVALALLLLALLLFLLAMIIISF